MSFLFLQLTVADEPDADFLGQVPGAELAARSVVAVLEPEQVALNHALEREYDDEVDAMRIGSVRGQGADLRVLLHHAVLTHIDPVLKAELVGHLPLRTLAETHPRRGFFVFKSRPRAREALPMLGWICNKCSLISPVSSTTSRLLRCLSSAALAGLR